MVVLGALLLAESAGAACNTAGCYAATIDFLKVDSAGRIWFVVADSTSLGNLVPADGCVLRQIWTGIAEYALFIRADDPDRAEKYATLLVAYTTGKVVGFSPIKETSTGWCSLKDLHVS
jgi:hypothetical protein